MTWLTAEDRGALLGLGAVLIGLALLATIAGEAITAFATDEDLAFSREVIAERSPTGTGAMRSATLAGGELILAVIAGLASVTFFAAGRSRDALAVVLAGIGAAALTVVIKVLVERPRPPLLHLEAADGASFPSGHVTGAAAIYTALALALGAPAGWRWRTRACLAAVVLIVGAVGVSRVYLGVHYPSDVVVGSVLGAAWAVAVRLLIAHGGTPRTHR